MTTDKKILDACCGGRMMWFDKADPDAIYMDIREEEFIACDGRRVRVHPDLIADFRNMPFEDESFKLVVFDPPQFNRLGANSYTAQKYGRLFPSWETDLKRGFDECMRVLEPFGILIFKGMRFKSRLANCWKFSDSNPCSVISPVKPQKPIGCVL